MKPGNVKLSDYCGSVRIVVNPRFDYLMRQIDDAQKRVRAAQARDDEEAAKQRWLDMALPLKCKKHPGYKALRQPLCHCALCWQMWRDKHPMP